MKLERNYTDEEIINGLVRNDISIIEYFYNNCFRPIRHLVVSNSGNEEDAKDIFQETLVILFRKFKEPTFHLTSSLTTFAYSVARLIWLKELRNRSKSKIEYKSEIDDGLSSEEKGTITLIEHNEKLRLYREKFEELSKDCKRILHMSLNNIPIKEITRVMGFSSDQHTKNRRYKCKKSLIERIRSSTNFKELSNEDNTED